MSVADFINGLPCHDEDNFTNFYSDDNKLCVAKLPVYLSTTDYPSAKKIIVEQAKVRLRYIYKPWKRIIERKRKLLTIGDDAPRKRYRIRDLDYSGR